MAGSVNRVILVGNLGKDPEVINGRNGKFAKLSVATSDSWRDRETGERKEVTDWHNVVIFNDRLVEICEKFLHKGNKVYVCGAQKTRTYEKDGETRYMTEVVLSVFGSELFNLTPAPGQRDRSPDDYGIPAHQQQRRTSDDDRPAESEGRAPRSGGSYARPDAGAGGWKPPRSANDMDDDIPF